MEAKLEATQAQIRSGLSEPKPEEMLFGFGEFQGFMSGPPHTTGNSSFTALLELPPPQAVELLVKEDFPDKPLPPPPIFPSNFALIDRDSSFSTFASASMSMKQEPLDSDTDPQPDSSSPASNQSQKSTKRKEREKKVKESNKKGKRVEANEGACEGGGEKLPYVHVRARRGQATDSHSLAERARREKINARMKLLQELVPGCNKVSC
ncbi:hypothetical protein ACJIZ3_005789 [Penstemon smallii]|uniref:BHLH domain-containing protein n=1 Tax=Penstemon smallii TaxID=265156 RepID=A0ABD3S610_9LAMI